MSTPLEHCVCCDWIIVKCHMFVTNLIIINNGWTRDTTPLTILHYFVWVYEFY